MGSLIIVVFEPLVQVLLHAVQIRVNFWVQIRRIELLQHRLVEALTDAVGLWTTCLGASVSANPVRCVALPEVE